MQNRYLSTAHQKNDCQSGKGVPIPAFVVGGQGGCGRAFF
jgi:hypothetical protein